VCVYACVCCERTQAYWRHSGRCDLFMHSERRFHILAASARSFVIPRERAQRQERGRECASEPKMTSPPPAGSHRELPVQAAPTTGASTLPPPAYAVPTIIFLFFFNAQLTAVEIKKRIRKQPNNSDTSEKSCCSHWCPWEKLGRWVNTTALHVGAACRRCMSAACRRCVSALHVGARSLTLLRREEQTGGAAARVPRMSAGRQWPCHFFRGPLPARSR